MKTIIQYVILSAVCFCVNASAQSYGLISGKIVSSDGTTISDAKVQLLSANNGKMISETPSDSYGNFRFERVPGGNYLVRCENVSFRDQLFNSSRDVVVRGGNTSHVSLILGNNIREEVTIVASGTEQREEEVSKSVTVIDGSEMRARADFALVETLKTVPGFRVQQLGGFGRTASIKSRGLRNQDTAILIDGMRFRDASSIGGDASAFLSDITLTSVDRIEILRGSGSSLYGTNAIGGVVDFITPSARQGLHGQLSGALGGLGLQRVRGNLSDGFNKFGYTLGVSRTRYAEGIDGNDNAANTNFQTRFDYRPFGRTNISGRIFVGDAYVRLNSSPDTLGTLPADPNKIIRAVALPRNELRRFESGLSFNSGNATFLPDANDPDNFQKSDFLSGQISVRHEFANNISWTNSFQHLRTNRKNTDGTLGTGFQPFAGDESYFFRGRISTFDSRIEARIRGNRIRAGYEFERETFNNRGAFVVASDNFSTTAKQNSQTAYIQDLFSFLRGRLQFSLAARTQYFSLKRPGFNPASNLFQNLTTQNPPRSLTGDATISYFLDRSETKFRAHIGNGYRVPSLYERFSTFFFFSTFFQTGNPALRPERSEAFDFGADQNLAGGKVKLSGTYFYTRLRNLITFRPSDALSAPAYFNFDGAISRGAEFSARFTPHSNSDFSASYTIINSDQRVYNSAPSPAPVSSNDRRSFGIPNNQFTLIATQKIGARLALNFDFLATSNYLAPIFSSANFQSYAYQFRGARRGDFSATYEIPTFKDKVRFRLYGTVENLFGYEYFENGFQTIRRTARGGLGLNF